MRNPRCIPCRIQTHISCWCHSAGSLTSQRTIEQSGGGGVTLSLWKESESVTSSIPLGPLPPLFFGFRLPGPLLHSGSLATCLSWNVVIDHVCATGTLLSFLSEWCSVHSCLKSKMHSVLFFFFKTSFHAISLLLRATRETDNWNSASVAWRTKRHQICRDVWTRVKIPGVDRNLQPLWENSDPFLACW